MKKSIFILASIYLLLLSSPIVAQPEEPGVDPVAAPINDYLWILGIIGITLVFLKFRALQKQAYNSLK